MPGLEWARHVFLDEPVPHLLIEDTLIVVEGKVVPSSPKTDAGYRVVPLDPETVDVSGPIARSSSSTA